jgi:hypothetical protein
MQGFVIASLFFLGLPMIGNCYGRKKIPTDIGPQFEGD